MNGDKLNILLIVPHYAPDLGPSAPLFTMLSKELRKRGHQISVLTTVPHYPSGQVPTAFRGKFIQKSFENSTEIIRIRIPSVKRANFSGRMLQYICYQIGASWAGMSLEYDCVFVANPALWVWLPFTCLCVIRRKPSVFSIYDVYPDVGIRLGIFKSKLVIEVVKAFESYCLKHSTIVRIISESFKPGINRLNVPDSKISLIYDWVDTDLIRPLPKDNHFRKKHGLDGHFVVLYAGNLGLSQGLENILIAAHQLRSNLDIIFVFIGDGSGRESLEKEVISRQLTNVRFIPFQPRELLPEVLASADVSLVLLKKGIGFSSLPSKILSIFASNRPIIASVDEDCETWDLIKKANAGICIPPEKPFELVNAILTLKQNGELSQQMGNNGRNWAMRNHSPQVAAEVFERLFYSISTIGELNK
jgi:colanic acid biosynthesis glycosyl transferase WcaI